MSASVTPEASLTIPNLLTQITNRFPELTQLAADLRTTEAQIQELANSTAFNTKIELTLKLANLRFQLLASKLASAALENLSRIMNCDKPETARRCANTILQRAGLLPAKKSSPKPWENSHQQNVITKQHPPIYNDLTTPDPTPQTTSPATHSAGTPASCRPVPPTTPQPTKIPQPHPISPAKTPASHPQNSPSKTNITKQHVPTYNNSHPLNPTYLQAATQAVSGTLKSCP